MVSAVNILQKSSIVDVWQGAKYVSDEVNSFL